MIIRALRSVIFLSAIALSGCSPGTSKAILPTILSIRGEPMWLFEGSTNPQRIQPDSKLRSGSVLQSSSDGQVDLVLVPGALARILPDSELEIESLGIDKDGNDTAYSIRNRIATIELRRGKVVALFEGAADFRIKTAAAEIDVLPSCLVSIDVDQTKTRVNCVRGNVRVRPRNGRETMVDAGYFQDWPSPGEATPTSEDQRAESAAISARDAGVELEQLSARQRDQLPGRLSAYLANGGSVVPR